MTGNNWEALNAMISGGPPAIGEKIVLNDGERVCLAFAGSPHPIQVVWADNRLVLARPGGVSPEARINRRVLVNALDVLKAVMRVVELVPAT